MAQRGSYGITPQLDLQQLQLEAQNRWLRPAEICEILRNYQKFHISSEPPTKPRSGSLFLFDRKVLRYFRKDGHNWRKKKDGKTVKEAHEKLKVGSVDVLHCYYAHGEDDEHFQRRSYWMLEQDQHIVFVHYLEVKQGNRTNVDGTREHDGSVSSLENGSPLSYSFNVNNGATPSGNTDSTSPTSTLTALCEDADSGDIRQASPAYPLLQPLPQQNASAMCSSVDAAASFNTHFSYPSAENLENHPGGAFIPDAAIGRPRSTAIDGISSQKSLGLASWEDILRSTGFPSNASSSSSQLGPTGGLGQETFTMSEFLGDSAVKESIVPSGPFQPNWQINVDNNSIVTSAWPIDNSLDLDLAYATDTRFHPQIKDGVDSHYSLQHPEPVYDQSNLLWGQHEGINVPDHPIITESHKNLNSNVERDVSGGQDVNYSFTARRLLSDGEESLKKVDSFSRWVSKELGDVENLQMQSTSGLLWSTVECENVVDESSLSPSISPDQLFSILNYSPKWAYSDSEIEVLIIGTFLKDPIAAAKYSWSCMFGEVEVPTRVLGNGLLSCRAPTHSVGAVPFYVTCSNRLACSEVREFDYRAGSAKAVDVSDVYGGYTDEIHLHTRLEKLLSLSSVGNLSISWDEKRKILSKVISLKEEEESYLVLEALSESVFRNHSKDQVLQILLREKLYAWLLHKVIEDGKGPSLLDDQGQGVLHLAVALGYEWTIKPVLAAGISINFRDINGWTALHWAAFCGREQTVAVLVSLGADTGLLSDPTPEYPLGRTPADLASTNGHKGISGFLAESCLTSFLSALTVEDSKDSPSKIAGTAVHTLSERSATPVSYGAAPDELSLKDSLTAVCNATQAADRIYQMFRIQSFQRKQLEYGEDDEARLNQRLISLAATKKGHPGDGLAHTAATQIQKKFRGWKKRKEFLIIRRRIVKIQAQWRGHQVRKQYSTIIWSVGILEKIILRWRRKGSGLRGYRSDALVKEPPVQQPFPVPEKEDDYDFLKEGRKQTEERLQKALTRVKSMVQYPDARAQYRRLLTVVEGFRENKACEMALGGTEETGEGEDDMLDIDALLDDDTLML